MSTPIEVRSARPRQVFLSHASADNHVAHRIAESLRRAGVDVWFDAWEVKPGEPIADKINDALSASDVMVVLLSPASVESRWVQAELNAVFRDKLRDRAILIIPALLADCNVPLPLRTLQSIDMRSDLDAGVQRLAEALGAVPRIDFSRLDGQAFERLVGDLLTEIGFEVRTAASASDSGVDLVASYATHDPFGVARSELWVVEAKLYRDQRVSVGVLRQMLGYLMTSGSASKGLVVTNGQLTSVARSYLEEARSRSGYEVRVIDGTELVQLLSAHPGLVDRYFAPAPGR